MIWDELTYLIPLLMMFLIFIVYAIVIGQQNRFVEKKQQNIEQLERLEELVKKYSYDYDAEPMRNEEGRMTRIPIKNDIDSICIGDRVCAYFWREMEDGRRYVIGTLEERKKVFDDRHVSTGEYVIAIRCDDGKKIMFYERNAVLIKIHTEISGKKEEEIMETCRQRLQREHPEKINSYAGGGCVGCPDDYGYIKGAFVTGPRCLKDKNNRVSCFNCWDRPVEKTLSDLYEDSIKAMRAYGSTDGEPMPPEVARKEKYEDAALECKALFDAMKDAGFDEHKAFMLTKTFIARSLGSKGE